MFRKSSTHANRPRIYPNSAIWTVFIDVHSQSSCFIDSLSCFLPLGHSLKWPDVTFKRSLDVRFLLSFSVEEREDRHSGENARGKETKDDPLDSVLVLVLDEMTLEQNLWWDPRNRGAGKALSFTHRDPEAPGPTFCDPKTGSSLHSLGPGALTVTQRCTQPATNQRYCHHLISKWLEEETPHSRTRDCPTRPLRP